MRKLIGGLFPPHASNQGECTPTLTNVGKSFAWSSLETNGFRVYDQVLKLPSTSWAKSVFVCKDNWTWRHGRFPQVRTTYNHRYSHLSHRQSHNKHGGDWLLFLLSFAQSEIFADHFETNTSMYQVREATDSCTHSGHLPVVYTRVWLCNVGHY